MSPAQKGDAISAVSVRAAVPPALFHVDKDWLELKCLDKVWLKTPFQHRFSAAGGADFIVASLTGSLHLSGLHATGWEGTGRHAVKQLLGNSKSDDVHKLTTGKAGWFNFWTAKWRFYNGNLIETVTISVQAFCEGYFLSDNICDKEEGEETAFVVSWVFPAGKSLKHLAILW